MTLATGLKTSSGVERRSPGRTRAGFTLVELLLVMALLATVLAYAAPVLSRFTSRRSLEHEARRLLAVIREAQNEAVSEGRARAVWLDPGQQRYGLEPTPESGQPAALPDPSNGLLTGDRFALHVLNRNVRLLIGDGLTGTLATVVRLVFLPDGTMEEGAPEVLGLEEVEVTGRAPARLYLTKTENGLTYEILNERDYALRLEQSLQPTLEWYQSR